MTEPQDKARDALFGAITEKVGSAETVEDVAKLADAYSAVAYGPQGQTTVYRYFADYHDTKHEGQRLERPTGFGE